MLGRTARSRVQDRERDRPRSDAVGRRPRGASGVYGKTQARLQGTLILSSNRNPPKPGRRGDLFELIDLPAGSALLDIPAGHGLQSSRITAMGYRVVSADID